MPVETAVMYMHAFTEDREGRFLIHITIHKIENRICFFLPDQYKMSTATGYKKIQAEK